MKSNSLLAVSGITVILGPWIYALIAIKMNPTAGNDGGVLELATYLSVVTIPLGLALLVLAFVKNRKK